MPKYRVLAKSFINNAIAEVGDVVEYNGKPGSNLELIPEKKAEAAPKKGSFGKSQDDGKDLV